MIVEDDEASEVLLSIMINTFCRETIKVNSGIEAIEACKNNTDIDLILMDIKMPDLDGYETTKRIRKFNKNVVIIAQTAFGLKGDREKAIEAGCNDYISKPIKQSNLVELIRFYFK